MKAPKWLHSPRCKFPGRVRQVHGTLIKRRMDGLKFTTRGLARSTYMPRVFQGALWTKINCSGSKENDKRDPPNRKIFPTDTQLLPSKLLIFRDFRKTKFIFSFRKKKKFRNINMVPKFLNHYATPQTEIFENCWDFRSVQTFWNPKYLKSDRLQLGVSCTSLPLILASSPCR